MTTKNTLFITSIIGIIALISQTMEASEDKISNFAAEYDQKFNREKEKAERRKAKKLELRNSEKEYNESFSQPNSPSLSPSSSTKVISPLQKPAVTNQQPVTEVALPKAEDSPHRESPSTIVFDAPKM